VACEVFLGGRGVVHHHPALALDLIDDHNLGAGAEGGNEDADGGLGRELLVLFFGELALKHLQPLPSPFFFRVVAGGLVEGVDNVEMTPSSDRHTTITCI